MKRRYPRYVSEFRDRHGKIRVRFRRKGQATYYFQAAAFSETWEAEYRSCLDGRAAPRIVVAANRAIPGSIDDLVARYYASPGWLRLEPATRRNFGRIIEKFRAKCGKGPVKGFKYRHAAAWLGTKAGTPHAANTARKVLKRLFKEAVRLGMIEENPWAETDRFETGPSKWNPWTAEERAKFMERWAIGTRERLAFELMDATGQRRGDAVRMGPQHIHGDRLEFEQDKTGTPLSLPISASLRAAIDEAKCGEHSFLITSFGKPYTPAGFGNWFREVCKAAGVAGRAHGLRKTFMIDLAEGEASQQEIKSWSGHKNDAEVRVYVEAANQKRLADNAAKKMANRHHPVSHLASQPIEKE